MSQTTWRILGERYVLALALRGDDGAQAGQRLDADEARRALDGLLEGTPPWGLSHRTLAGVARHVGARYASLRALALSDPRAAVREALARGVLTARREEAREVAAPAPAELDLEALMRVPLASSLLPKTWIEIELLDTDGVPVANEPYWIKLTDGTVREGALNRYGLAYFDELDPGICEVRWPHLDGAALAGTSGRPLYRNAAPVDAPVDPVTAPQGRIAPRVRTWIEVELVDESGAPVAGEPYSIRLTDGSVREGATDGRGRARFEDIDPGVCSVRWVGVVTDDVIEVTAA